MHKVQSGFLWCLIPCAAHSRCAEPATLRMGQTQPRMLYRFRIYPASCSGSRATKHTDSCNGCSLMWVLSTDPSDNDRMGPNMSDLRQMCLAICICVLNSKAFACKEQRSTSFSVSIAALERKDIPIRQRALANLGQQVPLSPTAVCQPARPPKITPNTKVSIAPQPASEDVEWTQTSTPRSKHHLSEHRTSPVGMSSVLNR